MALGLNKPHSPQPDLPLRLTTANRPMFIHPRSGGLRSAMSMGCQWIERIASHCPHMGRRFGDHLSLRRAHLTLFHSTFNVKRSVFGVHHPKEWWTPIRHAHEKPMGSENHSSFSPHGQGDRTLPHPPHRLHRAQVNSTSLSGDDDFVLALRHSTFLTRHVVPGGSPHRSPVVGRSISSA
jgi:hypothetical protein